ncbi:hypothetical protein CLV92_1222 [Kineococcus xinjiangensis]|uniref:Nucleotidase n=2 Tax=Kineococcus xinjiangensis TaxID=512762 RepID=A0A2S6ICB4_9ACTN|nr:hypothetical protein CLV92_1222 [Kineococcus xinjiangensis]
MLMAEAVRSPSTLGVDIGGVIVARADHDDDTSFFGSRPLQTPAVPGALEALAHLHAGPFCGRVHLVSKASARIEAVTRAWLAHHQFFDHTGIDASHLHFVRERREKARVCKELGVTHFVDDRLDVLALLETVDHRYWFTGGLPGSATSQPAPAQVTRIAAWSEAHDLFQGRAAHPMSG